jgi:hypothetical protein
VARQRGLARLCERTGICQKVFAIFGQSLSVSAYRFSTRLCSIREREDYFRCLFAKRLKGDFLATGVEKLFPAPRSTSKGWQCEKRLIKNR